MNFKDTQTAKNLMKAYAGESQATARYKQYASIARKEGYVQIEKIFLETADQEFAHGKLFYKYLNAELKGEQIEITASFPIQIGTTAENLYAAAEGENGEWTDTYKHFQMVAKEEGFDEIAHTFGEVSEVEEAHETRFKKLLNNIENDRVFHRDEEVRWICQNCGYIHDGTDAPQECPACKHPQGYFKLFCEEY